MTPTPPPGGHRPPMNTAELAVYTNTTTRWVRRHVQEGDLPVVRFGRLVRFLPDDIDRWIEERRAESDISLEIACDQFGGRR